MVRVRGIRGRGVGGGGSAGGREEKQLEPIHSTNCLHKSGGGPPPHPTTNHPLLCAPDPVAKGMRPTSALSSR